MLCAVLQGARLVRQSVLDILRAVAQGIRGVRLALLAKKIIKLLVQAGFVVLAVHGYLLQLVHQAVQVLCFLRI